MMLGRRSSLPTLRYISIGFIEFWRGVPLITVLFMSAVMFPMFLPDGTYVDKLITLGKKGDLNSRRKAYSLLPEKEWASKLFDELSERYKDRKGGYTRVLKAGFRYGDSAPMAVIELIDRNPEALGQDSGPIIEENIEDPV